MSVGGRARSGSLLCDGEREGGRGARSSEWWWWARKEREAGGGGETERGGRRRSERGAGGGRRGVPCNASRCAARRTVRCGDGARVAGSDGCRGVREGDARARGGSWRALGRFGVRVGRRQAPRVSGERSSRWRRGRFDWRSKSSRQVRSAPSWRARLESARPQRRDEPRICCVRDLFLNRS